MEEESNIIYKINIDYIKYLSHYRIIIEGIVIFFPYKPYPSQEEYMKKVILTLKSKGNISALESPTGTGKTLCLLCSILAWIKHNEDDEEKNIHIYYCTRTISQIKNIMHELNKTCYKVGTSFFASRKYCCLQYSKLERNNMDSSKLLVKCKKLRKTKNCIYYENKDYDYYNYNDLEDIEDLFKIAKKKEFCPYFYNLNKSKSFANITFISYNYILNKFIRKKLNKIIKNNSIIILDEAHNICNIFEGLFTKNINLEDLEQAETLFQLILDNYNSLYNIINQNEENNFNNNIVKQNNINEQINVIKNFLKYIKPLKIEKDDKCQKFEGQNCYLCNALFFKRKFIDFSLDFYEKIVEFIEKTETELEEYCEKLNINYPIKTLLKKPKKIYEFLNQLKTMKKDEEISFKFILYTTYEDLDINDELNELKFEIYCVDASYGMKDLLTISPYSIILTSGTLCIDSMENLLQIKFKEVLQNEHIIKK